jgi:DNA-binding CsgD family transcriptional regulator
VQPTLTIVAMGRAGRRDPPPAERWRVGSFEGAGRAATGNQAPPEKSAADLLAAALEALGMAAFICDGTGAVRALTAQAEAVLRRGVLEVRHGRLRATGAGAAALGAAIDKALSAAPTPGEAPLGPVVVQRDEALEVLDIVALPRTPSGSDDAPRALVVAAGGEGRQGAASRALIQTAYGLTAAESAIALQLAEGQSTEAIAASLSITTGTLRSHIKSVFRKVGVNRRAELAARLRQFR